MSEMESRTEVLSEDILALTANIVAAHVRNNNVSAETRPTLIREVYNALNIAEAPAVGTLEKLTPAVPIKKSVFPDYIICLEDGKKLKMLKRHLASAYNMTPDQYRNRWSLPPEYPLVAPNYAMRRSELARSIGLGQRIKVQDADALEDSVPVRKIPAKRRGRKPAA
ncbi:MucR family transcriptional regulator [Kozakia baliensis]|uniref:MucR family transcriptional regulator n=1 Tax=Kozakia baliensis TaxID=153496 RepID=UPI0009DDCB9F|nr:MucR family transcriptional regulator [Kozakia baliensis]